MAIWAAHIDVDSTEAELFDGLGGFGEHFGLRTPNLSDDWLLFGQESQAFEGVWATFFADIAIDICKFGEENVWARGGGDHLAKCDVCDTFHWSKTGEARRKLFPEIHFDIITQFRAFVKCARRRNCAGGGLQGIVEGCERDIRWIRSALLRRQRRILALL